MVDEHVALAKGAEEVGRAGRLDLGEVLVRAGDERLEVQLGSVEVGHLGQAAQVERAAQVEHLVVA